jgi:cap1 methyltransferase
MQGVLFQLPNATDFTLCDKNVSIDDNTDPKLASLKRVIKDIDPKVWKKARWVVNKYEFEHNDVIINRSYYKFFEMVKKFQLFKDTLDASVLSVLYCAEAPGGFIQCGKRLLPPTRPVNGFDTVRANKYKDRMFTISKNKNYDKRIIHDVTIIQDEEGGDITKLKYIDMIKSRKPLGFTIITADGGFDDFYNMDDKETSHYKLILSELLYIISLQEPHGHCILKMFDTVTMASIDILYILNLLYDHVSIYKPETSRPTNSEKYIVCKGFKEETDLKNLFIDILKKRMNEPMARIFVDLPVEFVDYINSLNERFTRYQIFYLERAIQLVTGDFLEKYQRKRKGLLEEKKSYYKEWLCRYSDTP